MSRNSKQKRDARRKAQRRGPTPPRADVFPGAAPPGADGGDPWFDGADPWGFDGAGPPGPAAFFRRPDPESELYRLIETAAVTGFGRDRDGRAFTETVRSIIELSALVDPGRAESAVTQYLERLVGIVFESGWQPAELAHLAARDVGGPENRLLALLIGSHASTHAAFDHAPPEWRQQLHELGVRAGAPVGITAFRQWMRTEELTRLTFWEPALKLLSRVGTTGVLPELLPPPPRWRSAARRAPERRSDAKILNRIRGLLAKAEASEFAEEAESLSAKAQDLMTRHAIEAAMLDADAGADPTSEVRTRRLLIDNPYPDAKTALLNAVSRTNGAKVIWHKEAALASIVGMPVDLDLCELLYTSLLVQSSHALREAGTQRFARSPSFRRSFLVSYAARIGERLAEARDRASAAAAVDFGKALVPVLTERAEAVEDVFAEQFPDTVAISHAVTNGAGWARGREAAESADLTGGRKPVRGG